MWIKNARVRKGTVYSLMSESEAEIVRQSCSETKLSERIMRTLSRGPTEYKELQGFILQETEKAIKFKVDMEGNLLHRWIGWLPVSQMERIVRSHSHEDEHFDQVWIADWLFRTKAEEYANVCGDD